MFSHPKIAVLGRLEAAAPPSKTLSVGDVGMLASIIGTLLVSAVFPAAAEPIFSQFDFDRGVDNDFAETGVVGGKDGDASGALGVKSEYSGGGFSGVFVVSCVWSGWATSTIGSCLIGS